MTISLRVGGYAATEIAAHTPPTWETWADGGTGSISWAFALTPRSQHQALRVNKSLVEVMMGPVALATAILGDYDRTTGECTAYGLGAAARNYLALDSEGSNTRNVAFAVETAVFNGWPIKSTAAAGVASGDPTGNPITMGQLLDEYAEQTGQRWVVDAHRHLYLTPGPSFPQWLASPDAAAFGTTNEDRAVRLYGRYLDSSTGTYLTAAAGTGAPQDAVDLSERGAMSGAQASAILQGLLDRDRSVTAWTNGVTLTPDQIQTMGGTPAFLPAVKAGQMMRSFGLSYAGTGLKLDTVIGKTRYTAGDRSIYVEPVNTAPRTFADILVAT